jgi:predicted alpha-1,6-mannanase (GH76 family)
MKRLLAVALSLGLLAGCAASTEQAEEAAAESDDALSVKTDGDRADLATDRLVNRFWETGRHYLADSYPSDGKDAGYWIYAQAFDAVLDEVTRTRGAKMKPVIARLYDAQARRGFKSDFFDDETWMGIALVRAHDLTGARRYLDEALVLGRDIRDHAWVAGKGVWWDQKHTSHATASNFGPVILAVKLFERTRDASFERFAKDAYAHWYASMVNPTTHQVADHVTAAGKVEWWKFSYNEGLAIGASLAMHTMTRDPKYMQHAHEFASFMIKHETAKTPYGDVLSDGNGCSGDCDAFKGIAYRYLTALYESDRSHAEYRAVLDSSAAAIWANARETASTTFGESWSARASGKTSLAADAAAAMALNLAAGVDR